MTRDAKEPDRENRYFNPFKFYLFSCCIDYTKFFFFAAVLWLAYQSIEYGKAIYSKKLFILSTFFCL
jgi:hypothetical protein